MHDNMKKLLLLPLLFSVQPVWAQDPGHEGHNDEEPDIPDAASTPIIREPAGAVELRQAMLRLGQNRRDVEALIAAGNASLTLNDPEAALNFYMQANDLRPNDGRVNAGMGAALVRAEDPFTALAYFDQAVRLGISERAVAFDRGLAYDLLGNFDRAQQDYQLASTISTSEQITIRRAISLALAGKKKESDQLIRPLLDRNNPAAWRAQTFMLASYGEYEESRRVARSFLTPNVAQRMDRYLKQMPDLTGPQKAAAIHLGHFPARNIGRDSEAVRTASASSAAGRPAQGGGRLTPAGQPFGQPNSVASSTSTSTSISAPQPPPPITGPILGFTERRIAAAAMVARRVKPVMPAPTPTVANPPMQASIRSSSPALGVPATTATPASVATTTPPLQPQPIPQPQPQSQPMPKPVPVLPQNTATAPVKALETVPQPSVPVTKPIAVVASTPLSLPSPITQAPVIAAAPTPAPAPTSTPVPTSSPLTSSVATQPLPTPIPVLSSATPAPISVPMSTPPVAASVPQVRPQTQAPAPAPTPALAQTQVSISTPPVIQPPVTQASVIQPPVMAAPVKIAYLPPVEMPSSTPQAPSISENTIVTPNATAMPTAPAPSSALSTPQSPISAQPILQAPSALPSSATTVPASSSVPIVQMPVMPADPVAIPRPLDTPIAPALPQATSSAPLMSPSVPASSEPPPSIAAPLLANTRPAISVASAPEQTVQPTQPVATQPVATPPVVTPPTTPTDGFDLGSVVESINVPETEKQASPIAVDLDKLPVPAAKPPAIQPSVPAKDLESTSKDITTARHWVQISTGEKAVMASEYRRLSRQSSALFKDLKGWTSPWKDTQARLLIGPFESFDAANTWYGEYKAAGGDSYVWRNPQGTAVTPLQER